jgi:hypothetical protein
LKDDSLLRGALVMKCTLHYFQRLNVALTVPLFDTESTNMHLPASQKTAHKFADPGRVK